MSNPAELPGSTLSLFPPGELPEGAELLLSAAEQRNRYTLSTIEKNTERLNAAIMLLGSKAPRKFIMETLHIGWYTLQQIAQQHGDKITHVKKRCASNAALFVELGLEQMIEDLQAGRLAPDKLPLSVKVIGDLMLLLTGDATMIFGSTATQGQRLTVDTLKTKLATMKRTSGPVVDGVLDTTHSAAREISPIAEPGADRPTPGAPAADLPSEGIQF